MGASEDRATLREQERVIAASNVTEIMIPGYGIWTVDAIRGLLEERESERLREKHKGDSAYDSLHSPRLIRAQEQRDRESDEMARGWR